MLRVSGRVEALVVRAVLLERGASGRLLALWELGREVAGVALTVLVTPAGLGRDSVLLALVVALVLLVGRSVVLALRCVGRRERPALPTSGSSSMMPKRLFGPKRLCGWLVRVRLGLLGALVLLVSGARRALALLALVLVALTLVLLALVLALVARGVLGLIGLRVVLRRLEPKLSVLAGAALTVPCMAP